MDKKAQSNFAKHGVSFEDARSVFDDAFAMPHGGFANGGGEARYLITGMANGVLLTVAFTERGERTRIISARKATRHEQRDYYRNQTPV